jgi:uncharacterized protein (TIGR03437 family)
MLSIGHLKAMRTTSTIAALILMAAVSSQAGTTVWGINASFGNPHIQAYDLDTGVAVADFVAPNKDANRGRANGRGIAIAGTTLYYSLADTPNVYKTDTVTHSDLGIAFSTPLAPGINSLAWDGTNLWLVASQPSDPNIPADDKIYKYSPAGLLLQTLVLVRPANSNLARDGVEITPFGIVADRGSVPYDLYDLSGQLKQAALITASFRTTGIAYDGTNYIVSDAVNGRLAVFDTSGTFLRSVTLSGAVIPNGIVDLAVIPAAGPQNAGPQFTAAGVLNAASYASGGVAPGEIITIFGDGLGPGATVPLSVSATGFVNNVDAGTRVLFDGVPSPVIFTYSKQIAVVVPYFLAGKASTLVQVEYQNVLSAPVQFAITASVPGILTSNGSGTGQGAILNQDGSVNSISNPAQKGSVVVVYATGEGQTSPAGVDGKLAGSLPLPAPLLPVKAAINNGAAEVLYSGASPTLVAGVFQTNVRVPLNTPAETIRLFCRSEALSATPL